MLARVPGHVDALARDGHRPERRLGGRGGRRHQREHRAVVCGIGLYVEQPYTGDAGEGGTQRVDGRLIAAFGEIRNAFD